MYMVVRIHYLGSTIPNISRAHLPTLPPILKGISNVCQNINSNAFHNINHALKVLFTHNYEFYSQHFVDMFYRAWIFCSQDDVPNYSLANGSKESASKTYLQDSKV